MPIFEFKCEKCGYVFDELVKSYKDGAICPRCRSNAERSYSGKMYSATGKASGGCSGNCSTCNSRCH